MNLRPLRLAAVVLFIAANAALAGKPLPKPLHFESKPDGGWRLENSRTGETVEGYLSP